jgi:hypothetical protein
MKLSDVVTSKLKGKFFSFEDVDWNLLKCLKLSSDLVWPNQVKFSRDRLIELIILTFKSDECELEFDAVQPWHDFYQRFAQLTLAERVDSLFQMFQLIQKNLDYLSEPPIALTTAFKIYGDQYSSRAPSLWNTPKSTYHSLKKQLQAKIKDRSDRIRLCQQQSRQIGSWLFYLQRLQTVLARGGMTAMPISDMPIIVRKKFLGIGWDEKCHVADMGGLGLSVYETPIDGKSIAAYFLILPK